MKKEGIIPNEYTYATILPKCDNLTFGKELHQLIIKDKIKLTIHLQAALITMYGKFGYLDIALSIFNSTKKDLISWNAIISAFVKQGNSSKAKELFLQMKKEGFIPNDHTYASLAIRNEHHELKDKINLKSGSENALITKYGNSGNLDEAILIFNKVKEQRNIYSWNAMLRVLAQNGLGKNTIELFIEMENNGIIPDKISFTNILNACSHSSLINEAFYYFKLMEDKYKIKPDVIHYTCMVDALSRANRLDEAEDMLNKMENQSIIAWKSLLSACRWHSDIERAKRVAYKALKLEPQTPSIYVLLANTYSIAGYPNEAIKIRKQMDIKGIKKIPAETTIIGIEKEKSIYRAFNGEDDLFFEVQSIISKVEQIGYIPDTRFVLHNLTEQDKIIHLFGHSEKRALAVALKFMPIHLPIQLIKNLRVCPDCHNFMKYVSKLYNRKIIMRDTNRFHRFQDQHCDCNDYW
jgi:pentatricopeptide repeat protein